MRFSVVGIGYDQRQVDSCLDDLAARLTELAARAETAARVDGDWERIRDEAIRLRALLDERRPPATPRPARREDVDGEAAAILARARSELELAREEARELRDQAYAEAVQARRDFEAALLARRRREEQADEILTGIAPVPVDTPTAAAGLTATGVPATRPTPAEPAPAPTRAGGWRGPLLRRKR